ncbi:MAG: O-acetyl-ADP-ribose deacetylase [Candidatus Krumholzibacteria bacterium]|nr:O-acetyl-ADP-ribose deacetylase [Candidatus Krumholzibacteria bacterium]
MVHEFTIDKARLVLKQGDITREDTDAIVNAANASLMGGGGVDGAIHRAGGPAILEACKAIVAERGRLPTGHAVITPGGNLPARHVIHTVGPVWRDGTAGEPALLADAYRNSLGLVLEHGLASVAFPSISTGAYGYPIGLAAEVALLAVTEELRAHGRPLEVRFVLFSSADLETYERTARAIAREAGADSPPDRG